MLLYLLFCNPAHYHLIPSLYNISSKEDIFIQYEFIPFTFINLFFSLWWHIAGPCQGDVLCVLPYLIWASYAMIMLDCGKPITRMYCSCRGKHMWCEERTRRLELGGPVYHLFPSPSWAREPSELLVRSALPKSNPKTACNPKGGVITMSSSGIQHWQPKQPRVLCKCLHTSHAIILLYGRIAAIMRKPKMIYRRS